MYFENEKAHVMEKVINMGRIEELMKGKAFSLAGICEADGYNLKKVYVGEDSGSWVKQMFPDAEIVDDVQSIINDEKIDLVIMPTRQSEELKLVAKVLETGKNIRIV
jgi:predicted dehydrogenase